MANTVNPFAAKSEEKKAFTGPGKAPTPARKTAPVPNAGMPFGVPDFMAGGKLTPAAVAANSPSYISEGRHLAAIRSVDTERMSRKGDPMIVFSLEIIDGPDTGKTKDYYLVVMEKLFWLLQATGEAIGVPTELTLEDFANAVDTVVIAEIVPGDEYNGRPQTKINRLHSPIEVGIEAGTKHTAGTPVLFG
jgi:hypothetical protein